MRARTRPQVKARATRPQPTRGAGAPHAFGWVACVGGFGVSSTRHDERGANTPWCLTSGVRGGGMSAASLAMKSIDPMTRWVRPWRGTLSSYALRPSLSTSIRSALGPCKQTRPARRDRSRRNGSAGSLPRGPRSRGSARTCRPHLSTAARRTCAPCARRIQGKRCREPSGRIEIQTRGCREPPRRNEM